MTGYFAYNKCVADLVPSDSTEYSPPFGAFMNNGPGPADANITTPNGDDVTVKAVQSGQIVPISIKKLRVGSGTNFMGLRWRQGDS